jgi:hypothetical protein
LCFYLTLFGFILGCAKYMQVNEIIMNFNFKTYLAIKMTQCFAELCSSRTKVNIKKGTSQRKVAPKLFYMDLNGSAKNISTGSYAEMRMSSYSPSANFSSSYSYPRLSIFTLFFRSVSSLFTCCKALSFK